MFTSRSYNWWQSIVLRILELFLVSWYRKYQLINNSICKTFSSNQTNAVMNRISQTILSCGFWLRLAALLVIFAITYLWLSYNELPFVSFTQEVLFYHAVGGYIIYITVTLVTLFLEPPNDISLRLFGMFGGCLFTVVGTIGCINCSNEEYPSHSLGIALLCLVVGVFLIGDVISLECARTMERIDPEPWYWPSLVKSQSEF